MYVLKNTETGKYVAKPGLKSSYTMYLKSMELFSTRESAIANSCKENEVPVPLESLLPKM